jgi:hypothetical protein
MDDTNTYWKRRKRLIVECHRCEESNRFLVLAIPLYIFFPVILLAVIPVYILSKRTRYLALQQLTKDQKKFCSIISGLGNSEAAIQTRSK